MTSTMKNRSTAVERMSLREAQLMMLFITEIVSPPIGELSGFCNFSVKITMLITKITSEISLIRWSLSILLLSLQINCEIYLKRCVNQL